MCACDGIEPSEALSRSRGGYRRQANAIKTARKGTAKKDKSESNEKSDKVVTRSVSSSRKKRKRSNNGFHKVGKIRDDVVKSRKKSRKADATTESSDDEDADADDSTYIDPTLRKVAKKCDEVNRKSSNKKSNKGETTTKPADDDNVIAADDST